MGGAAAQRLAGVSQRGARLRLHVGEKTDQAAASHNVAVMISSAVTIDPEWFWRNVRKADYWRRV
jgi:hypothetical protein